jgi:hypothetical protein
MDSQPELRIRYRELERVRPWGSGRYEFGRECNGLTLIPRSPALIRNMHRICGWFDSAGGWSIRRSHSATHVTIRVESGKLTHDLEPGEDWKLQRGTGRATITLSNENGTEQFVVSWEVVGRSIDTVPAVPRSGTETVPIVRRGSRTAIVSLSPRQELVMATIASRPGPGSLTARQVAKLLGLDLRQVRKAVEGATRKVRDWCEANDEEFPSQRGLANSAKLAEWLVARGVITRTS